MRCVCVPGVDNIGGEQKMNNISGSNNLSKSKSFSDNNITHYTSAHFSLTLEHFRFNNLHTNEWHQNNIFMKRSLGDYFSSLIMLLTLHEIIITSDKLS